MAEDNRPKTKTTTTKILAAWYNELPQLTWEDVVDSLMCCRLVKPAVTLATKVEVDWEPLYEKYKNRSNS